MVHRWTSARPPSHHLVSSSASLSARWRGHWRHLITSLTSHVPPTLGKSPSHASTRPYYSTAYSVSVTRWRRVDRTMFIVYRDAVTLWMWCTPAWRCDVATPQFASVLWTCRPSEWLVELIVWSLYRLLVAVSYSVSQTESQSHSVVCRSKTRPDYQCPANFPNGNLVPKVDDIGWPWSAISSNFFEEFRVILQIWEATTAKRIIDPYCQRQRCNPVKYFSTSCSLRWFAVDFFVVPLYTH